jgi:hypothetical protein
MKCEYCSYEWCNKVENPVTCPKCNRYRNPLRSVWGGMKQRCYNLKDNNYKNYGGRGIKICEEWLNFDNFDDWAKDKYKKGLQIDRIDNEKGYYPENCRFTTALINNRNQRPYKFFKRERLKKILNEIDEMIHLSKKY